MSKTALLMVSTFAFSNQFFVMIQGEFFTFDDFYNLLFFMKNPNIEEKIFHVPPEYGVPPYPAPQLRHLFDDFFGFYLITFEG